jgi:arylsulfatase A-like enzyme
MRGSVTAGTDVTIPAEGYRDYLLAGVSDDLPEHHPAFDRGIDFITRHAEAAHNGTPFFCFVSVSEPHDPYIAPRKFFEQYDLDAIELSATLHDEPTGKPEVVARMARVWENMTDTQWRVSTAAYLAVMSFLDAEVGRIVAAVKNAGLYDDTIIVLSSDHGDMLGAHGLATKGVGTPYEEVYNIPLIVRVPGCASGEQNDAVASIVDIGPTLLDLCGLDALPAAQGRSFRAVLDGSAAMHDWRDAYAEFYGQRFVYTQRIVWHADWKYVFTPGGVDELYNLADDPGERYNLVDEPACRAVLVDMCTRMWRTMKTIGDDSLYNTQYATLRTAPVGPLVSGDA